ncbi:hypothetical protein [Methanobacterium paludis]|uniref:Uncharacterized protein n=1 Tax=Methanobacterium paludis (strain DSM 25820 / JCM 18151 / SWAN1) TaxID=868131 RepID=F6D576_METPW|nr:hypothetical protein [Methanobacterium paludis]AEG18184.1 hypothetical protein MSWAN_1167 [Methanobacterium paludis]
MDKKESAKMEMAALFWHEVALMDRVTLTKNYGNLKDKHSKLVHMEYKVYQDLKNIMSDIDMSVDVKMTKISALLQYWENKRDTIL